MMGTTMATALAHDGAVINVQVHGSGPTILMHPQPAHPGAPPELLLVKAALDRALIDGLSDRYRLVMFEYPGAPKPDTLTPSNVVADLLAIADAAEAQEFAWCGYSWTAVIGLQLALDNDRLTGLICGGWPPIHGPYKEMLSVIEGAQAGEGPSVLMSLAPPIVQQFATFYRGVQAFDDGNAQQRIGCPRLCFAGSVDNVYDLGIGRTAIDQRDKLEESGWDVRIEEGLDHGDLLQPDAFVPLIADWLDEHLHQ
jgi:pimeloyl-ACP methyl ester carboxylesterase